MMTPTQQRQQHQAALTHVAEGFGVPELPGVSTLPFARLGLEPSTDDETGPWRQG